jgi:hypothetical protein
MHLSYRPACFAQASFACNPANIYTPRFRVFHAARDLSASETLARIHAQCILRMITIVPHQCTPSCPDKLPPECAIGFFLNLRRWFDSA